MKMNQMYPSKYLKADELGDSDHTFTISKIVMETLGQGAEADTKPVAYFKEIEKGLVLNKTNASTITKIAASDDTDDWIGKKITCFATEVQFGADMVLSIRVRLPRAPATQFKQLAPTPGGVTKEAAWALVLAHHNENRDAAEEHWKQLRGKHGENFAAIKADVEALSQDLSITEDKVPF